MRLEHTNQNIQIQCKHEFPSHPVVDEFGIIFPYCYQLLNIQSPRLKTTNENR